MHQKDLEETVANIRETVAESVKAHQISGCDVKVGSFLSGGIDSSYIAALLKPDKSFSVGSQIMKQCSTRQIMQKTYRIF